MVKVNLDALIPREDFEIQDTNEKTIGLNTTTITVRDFAKGAFFFEAIKKPDFQRETNEWSPEKIFGLIESFLNGDLIPAIILWRSAGGYTFVIDGSHRISALAAWVNDDYGDGAISKNFYDSIIPDEQIRIADETRLMIKRGIGPYADYVLAATNPEKVKPEIAKKAKILGSLAIQLQWVSGNAENAENSFFKINQSAAVINPTELKLLEARKEPNCIAARAMIRSGTGHKYWSRFSVDEQKRVEELAKKVNGILFAPPLHTPIKTLDIPIGGKLYTSQTLPLLLGFVNIVNGIKEQSVKKVHENGKNNGLYPDTGEKTIKYLENCLKIAQKINSNQSFSLGLHPAVYFYAQNGRHKTASFYAITALMMELDSTKKLNDFIKIREKFEQILIEYDYLVQQIFRKYRSALEGYPFVKEFYLEVINKLLENKSIEETIDNIIIHKDFSYLKKSAGITVTTKKQDFSSEVKSNVFIKEALKNALKCKICNGYIHMNAISIDHIKRKEDGGIGILENAQLTHPYCNTTVKN